MRCPKCSYISFDNLASCQKCSSDLSKLSGELHGTAANISPFPFMNSILQSLTESDAGKQEGLGTMLQVPDIEEALQDIGDITDDMAAEAHANHDLEIPEGKTSGEITLLAVDGDITLAEEDEITLRIDEEIALSIDDLGKTDQHAIGISDFEEEVEAEKAALAPRDLQDEESTPTDEEERGLTLDLEDIDLSDLEPASVKAAITESEIAEELPESQMEIEGLQSLQLETDEAESGPAQAQNPTEAMSDEIEGLDLDFDEESASAPKRSKKTQKADSTKDVQEKDAPLDLSAMIQEGAKATEREEDSDDIMDLDLFHDDVDIEETTDALADFDLPETEGEGDLEIDLSLDDIHQDLDLMDAQVPEPAESLQPSMKTAEPKLEMEKKDTE